MDRLRLRAKQQDDCPLCREPLGEAARDDCPSCNTSYHSACLEELSAGTCSTLGCEARWALAAPKPLRAPKPEVAASSRLADADPDLGERVSAGARVLWTRAVRPAVRSLGRPLAYLLTVVIVLVGLVVAVVVGLSIGGDLGFYLGAGLGVAALMSPNWIVSKLTGDPSLDV